MKKTLRVKLLVVGATCAIAFAALMGAGCSPAASSSSGGSSANKDIAAAYPEHAANMESGAGLASYHAALGKTCTDCHTGDLNAEVATLDGVSGEPALASTYYMDSETCLSCHGGSWEALAKTTDSLGDYNPHASLHGTIENCNECHKGHADQVDVCSECHENGGQKMMGNSSK